MKHKRRGKGEGQIVCRTLQDGRKRWGYRIGYKGERVQEVKWKSRRAAQKALRKVLDRIDREGQVKEQVVPMDWLCDEYLRYAETNLGNRTFRERRIVIDAELKPFFQCLAPEVDFQRVEAFKTKRLKDKVKRNFANVRANLGTVRRSTINNELKALASVLKYGVKCNYLHALPVIERFRLEKKIPRFLTEDEIKRVLIGATRAVRLRLKILIFTGVRKGELAHIYLEDVDLKSRTLHIRARGDWKPKNGEDRVIPLCQHAVDALSEAVKRRIKAADGRPQLLPGRRGHLVDIRTGLNSACRRAKIRHVTVHTLRDTFGTMMAAMGADLIAIKEAMGHRDIRSTMIYVHAVQSHVRKEIAKLDGIDLSALRVDHSRARSNTGRKPARVIYLRPRGGKSDLMN